MHDDIAAERLTFAEKAEAARNSRIWGILDHRFVAKGGSSSANDRESLAEVKSPQLSFSNAITVKFRSTNILQQEENF